MAAAWKRRARAWRSKKISSSSAAHGSNTGEPTDAGSTTTNTTSRGTTCCTTSSVPDRERSFDFLPSTPVVEDIVDELDEEDFLPSTPVVEDIVDELDEEERAKQLEHIKDLVLRFPSDDSAPERWLSILQVTWVLHVVQVSEGSGRSFISGQLLCCARSWIIALFEITKSISAYFGGTISKGGWPPAASEFIRFVMATLSKMLPFVDAIVSVKTRVGPNDRRGEPADEKLQALILLHDALSEASAKILSYCTQDLLSTQLLMAKLNEATWNTMEETKAGFMTSWWGTPRSSSIHPFTRSFISHVKVLWANHGSVNRIIHNAFLHGEFVPEYGTHLTNLTTEMVHSLEENLTRESQLFPDQSLGVLFLINNFHYLLQQLRSLGLPIPGLTSKIDDHVNSFIRVSWAPVLKYLHNPTPRCFTRRSPLQKFESKFQKAYNTQKLWKVPDPEMKERMREAIIREVIPGFREFLKDTTTSTPRITPQVMENMLQELFEG